MVVTSTKKIERLTFSTPRSADFCSESELTRQTGHGPKEWPLVIGKELVDNAIDACEDTETPPCIEICVDQEGIRVTDKGPGMSPEAVEKLTDFTQSTSSRRNYIAPTRGAQGNGLQTILAMPFVLSNEPGTVEITSRNVCNELTFTIDSLTQVPQVNHRRGAANGKTGTTLKIRWPNSACTILQDSRPRFLQLADDFTFLNPHLSLAVDWFGERTEIAATNTSLKKWMPNWPSSAHWYTPEQFEQLLAAHIVHDAGAGRQRSVGDIVKDFHGLTGSAKRKAVLDATGLARTKLADLVSNDELRSDTVACLLAAMRANSKPVPPKALGLIGRDHLAQRFKELGCEMDTFEYKRVSGLNEDSLPYVLETAFASGRDVLSRRRLITGINWSPGIVNPFRTLGDGRADGLDALLQEQRAGSREPITVLIHLATPGAKFLDRGKSSINLI